MAQLIANTKENIDSLMDKSNRQFDAHNYIDSINTLIEAWGMLPEPKGTYDDSYHIAFFICDTYLFIKDYEKAYVWLDTLFKCDLERVDSGEREFLAAKIAFESGRLTEAKDLFGIANEKSEGRGFEDEDEKYFKFFSEGDLPSSDQTLNKELMQALNVSEKDLALNKQGKLSRKQERTILRGARMLFVVVTTLSLFLSLAMYLVVDKPLEKSQYFAMGSFIAILVGFALFFYYRSQKGIKKGVVKKCTGTISFGSYQGMSIMEVKEAQISFLFALADDLFKADKTYNVYYLDSTMEVLCIEEV